MKSMVEFYSTKEEAAKEYVTLGLLMLGVLWRIKSLS
jgi:hypothetical protein